MRIGKVTESILKRSVLKPVKTDSNKESAAARSDCAYSLDEDGNRLMSAVSSFAVSSEDAAYYAVHSAANNIFCDGGEPVMVVLNIMLPVEAEEQVLKTIMRSAIAASNELGIAIEGGHTEVTDAVTRPLISACVTGRGTYTTGNESKKASFHGKGADPRMEMDIVMTKWAGVEGTAILADKCAEKLKERLPDYMIRLAQDFRNLVSIRKDAEVAYDNGASALHDISQGGIFAALWDISARYGFGLEVDLKKIPIRQETIEITNHLGVNPYQLISGGSLLIIAKDGESMVRALSEAGIGAAVIGHTTDSNDKIIKNDDEIRYLDKPQPDELVRMAL